MSIEVRIEDTRMFTMILTFFVARMKETMPAIMPVPIVSPTSKMPGKMSAPSAARGTLRKSLLILLLFIVDILLSPGSSLGICVAADINKIDRRYLFILFISLYHHPDSASYDD